MPHLSTAERIGRREGLKDEARASIFEILEVRVGAELPDQASHLAQGREQFEQDPAMPDPARAVLMPMTTAERLGRIEGRKEEARTAIRDYLKIRTGAVPHHLASRLKQINDLDRLRSLRRLLVSGIPLTEFEQALDSI